MKNHPRYRRIVLQMLHLGLVFALVSQFGKMQNNGGIPARMSKYPASRIQQSTEERFDNKTITEPTRKGSIAFLFMTSRGLDDDLWKRWFPPQNDTRYSIFVHSVPSNTTVPLGPFFCQYVIPSVPTGWFVLHNGMMQVLQHAYHQDKQAQQFVFVSETSIPLVSFDEAYRRLIGEGETIQKSKFCLGQTEDFWDLPAAVLKVESNVTRKGEMWSSLSRTHTSLILKHRQELDEWNRVFLDITYDKRRRKRIGAPDECLFPTFLNRLIGDSQFESCEKKMSNCCTTMVVWHMQSQKVVLNDTIVLSDMCHGFPCTFPSLREEGLHYLADDGYVFLRKVPRHAIIQGSHGMLYNLTDVLHYVHQGLPISDFDKHRQAGTSTPASIIASTFECPAPVEGNRSI